MGALSQLYMKLAQNTTHVHFVNVLTMQLKLSKNQENRKRLSLEAQKVYA